jgi:hypothetical protein
MLSGVQLYESLVSEYDAALPFERICSDKNIAFTKRKLPHSMRGFTTCIGEVWTIVVNANIPVGHRRAIAWHELYHALSGGLPTVDRIVSKREEQNADVFAALCTIPHIEPDDTPHAIIDRYGVPYGIAAVRIQYELRRADS